MIAVTDFEINTCVGSKDLLNQILNSSFEPSQVDVFGQKVPVGVAFDPDLSCLSSPKIRKNMTRSDLLGVVTAVSLGKKIDLDRFDPNRVGLFVGCPSSQVEELSSYQSLLENSFRGGSFDSTYFGSHLVSEVNPMVLLTSLMNNVICYSSIELQIFGVNGNFIDFHLSSLRALKEAVRCLQLGLCDGALVGGVSAPLMSTGLYEMVENCQIQPSGKHFVGEAAAFIFLERTDSSLENAKAYISDVRLEYGDQVFPHAGNTLVKNTLGDTLEASFIVDMIVAMESVAGHSTSEFGWQKSDDGLLITTESWNGGHGHAKLHSPS